MKVLEEVQWRFEVAEAQARIRELEAQLAGAKRCLLELQEVS